MTGFESRRDREKAETGIPEKMDEKIGRALQGDIPLTDRPFAVLGKEAGGDERTTIETVRKLLDQGTIRKFGAILRHRESGYKRNAMILWAVPEKEAGKTGRFLSSRKEVTHCYERTPAFEGKYNLFTMVHFRDEDLVKGVGELARAAGIGDYRILESLEEFKKTSMEYF
jgi:DNA-binding Lrp family transcriptional regulator